MWIILFFNKITYMYLICSLIVYWFSSRIREFVWESLLKASHCLYFLRYVLSFYYFIVQNVFSSLLHSSVVFKKCTYKWYRNMPFLEGIWKWLKICFYRIMQLTFKSSELGQYGAVLGTVWHVLFLRRDKFRGSCLCLFR